MNSAQSWSGSAGIEEYRQPEGCDEEDVKEHVQQVGPWIVAPCRENLMSSCVELLVVGFCFLVSASEIRHVPHRNRGENRDGTVGEPVSVNVERPGPIPERDGEGCCDSWKEGVDESGGPEFACSEDSLNLTGVGPAWDFDEIVKQDDEELNEDEEGKCSLHVCLPQRAE